MIELIAGGARSGKSRYALSRAESLTETPTMVATATAGDAQMAERIQRHQEERGDHWQVVEEPLHLAWLFEGFGRDDVVVIDCLTLWLSNWLTGEHAENWPTEKKRFLTALGQTQANLLLVTNEVGLGVIPMGQLSRDFVDQSGWLHQDIAAIADRVTMLHFGIPQTLK